MTLAVHATRSQNREAFCLAGLLTLDARQRGAARSKDGDRLKESTEGLTENC